LRLSRLLLLLLLSGLLVALLLATLSRILLLLTRLLILLATLVLLAALVWIAHLISDLSVIDACRRCPWPMMRSTCAFIERIATTKVGAAQPDNCQPLAVRW
jgi:hypothetical protein